MKNALFRICSAAFLLDLAVMMAIVATPFFVLKQIQGGPGMMGVFGALQAVAYALTCLVSAPYVSRARNGMTWAMSGVLAFSVMNLALPYFRNPYLCGALSTLSHASLGLVWPALHSWVGGDPDPKTRSRRMAWFNIAWSFGFAVSPLFAGPLYDVDYRLPFAALFGIGLVTVALIRSLPGETDFFGAATEEMLLAREEHDRASEAFLYTGWCACGTAMILAGVTRNVYPKRVDDLVLSGGLRLLFEETPAAFLTHHSATKFSWLGAGLAFTTAVFFLVLGHTHFWRHSFRVLVGMQALAGAAFWVLGSTTSLLVMMACFVVVGANLGLGFFSGVYYSLGNPRHKHRRASVNEAVVGAGSFAGCIVYGPLAERFGVGLPFFYTPALIAAAIAAQAALLRYGRRRTGLTPAVARNGAISPQPEREVS